MGLEDREIDNKIAPEEIFIEVERNASTQIEFPESSFKNTKGFYSITLLQDVITQGLESVSRGLPILWIIRCYPFDNGDFIDSPLLKQEYHILDHPRRGDN